MTEATIPFSMLFGHIEIHPYPDREEPNGYTMRGLIRWVDGKGKIEKEIIVDGARVTYD